MMSDPFDDALDDILPWGVQYDVRCPACGHNWVAVMRIDTVGIECPSCGYYDPGHEWDWEG